MKLKTSCFNPTIFKKNITRFWPLWAMYLVVLFFSMPVTLFLHTRADNLSANASDAVLNKLSDMLSAISFNVSPMFVFVFAIVFAIAVFSYLYQAKSCYMIHALPVRRTELFVTNYISGILFLWIPQIITFLLSMFVCIINNVTSVEYLFYWLIYSMGMSFFFFSSAVFCCMLTGNYFAVIAFYGLGNVIYVMLKYLISCLVSTLCYGLSNLDNFSNLSSTKDACLSPIIFMDNHVNLTWLYDDTYTTISTISIKGGSVIAGYAVAAVFLIIAALLFYQRRQLECAGDIVSFSWMRPIFRWLVAFCMGSGLAMIFTQLFFYDSSRKALILFLCALIFSCIFFFLAEMLLQKKFRIFGRKGWLECAVCVCVTLGILASLDGDLFHIERKVPQADDVTGVVFNNYYDIVCTNEDDIEKIEQIHQAIVDHKKDYEQYYYDHKQLEDSGLSTVDIEYYLKDGRCISRSYTIPATDAYLNDSDSAAAKIRTLQSDPETFIKYRLCENYDEIKLTGGYFNQLDENDVSDNTSLSASEFETLYDAILKDIRSGNYPYGIESMQNVATQRYYEYVSLEGKINGDLISIGDVLTSDETKQETEYSTSSSYGSMYSSYNIDFSYYTNSDGRKITNVYMEFPLYDTCEYTIQALIDLGIIDSKADLTYESDVYDTYG
jgi:ABC-2 type transport system permease protein